MPITVRNIFRIGLAFILAGIFLRSDAWARHPVPREHPRLLGSEAELKELAVKRRDAFYRVTQVALEREGGDHENMISTALVYAIKGDQWCGETAVEMALKYIEGPIRTGHVTFGADLARCAIVYDLCRPCWSEEQSAKFIDYMNRTVDANVGSELAVFHNGWYSYKSWGIGIAAYATYYENPRAPEILKALEEEYRTRVVPSFALAGEGGGWAEGYYINYWLYKWLFFCEVALRCEGVDYFGLSPEFLGNRAVAGMFEAYPGISERNTRRLVPMGDGGGRVFTWERDEALAARRILVSRWREDPAHQVVQAFDEATPQCGSNVNAYKDFLWRDTTIIRGDLKHFKLSHISTGPGYVYARSSWEDDATYFFFKCGDRFTAHQNLDAGHFIIYKYEELAGQGGQFYSFATNHEVNYMLRSIAHNTVLVYDPAEKWPQIRAFPGEIGNDGGQHHDWPHHNGSVLDAAEWSNNRKLYDIADILAFEDREGYLYVAGDCSRAYRSAKLDYFTRQIVFIRPGTFVIFDRVKSTNPQFKKTWLLQALKPPAGNLPNLTLTNGRGRLFVQTLLPHNPQLKLYSGDSLYCYRGNCYLPALEVGPAPECRVEISPSQPARVDYFLHVLTATDSATASVPQAAHSESDTAVTLTLGETRLVFLKDGVGGYTELDCRRNDFASKIIQ